MLKTVLKRCSVPSVPVRGSAELKPEKMKDFGHETAKSDSKKGCDAWQEQLGVGLVGSWGPKQVFT